MKLIIIPTLNEKKNIKKLFFQIKKLKINTDILFIDDNSIDGTRNDIINFSKKYKKVKFIFRPKKLGIGSAHKVGLIYGYKNRYKKILTMDADGTHDPKYIKKMFKESNNFHLVITNRFIRSNSLYDWPLFRKILTTIRFYLINILLNFNYDSSGAYRCYNVKKIKINDILLAKDLSYSFFWESIYHLHKKKYLIKQIAVNLPFRKTGSSKMKLKDIIYSLFYLFFYFIKNILSN
jgi:dolichol-phosphate mannosyltransferase